VAAIVGVCTGASAATNSYRDPECSRLGLQSTTMANACYVRALQDTREELREHRAGIAISSTIPAQVKAAVITKYDFYLQAIKQGCKDAECLNNEMRELDKILYEMTKQYTGTGTPYQ
jgi:hypothetical protein